MTQCEHPAGKCNNADDCAEHICAQPKQKPTLLWDLIDPGWREREVERYKALAAAMPVHRPLVEIGRRATPCGSRSNQSKLSDASRSSKDHLAARIMAPSTSDCRRLE